MNPFAGIALVLVLLGVLMGVVKGASRKWSLHPELSRKAVHIGMGLICLFFPWIFSTNEPVLLLALLAVLSLVSVRVVGGLKKHLGSVLGGVARRTWGDVCFPVAVALLFWLSAGNRLLYVIPVLTLTLADALGALIGIRYGLSRYQTDEGQKSVEGSFAFFTVAFMSVHIPLLLYSDTGRVETLLIALAIGCLVMLLEAISWRGFDNLIVPLGVFLLLKLYLLMTVEDLLLRLLVMLVLLVFVLTMRKRTTLNDSAVLAAALSGYAVWALGDWTWLLPPLMLFIIYLLMPAFPLQQRPRQSLPAVMRVMSGAFLWLFLSHLCPEQANGFYAAYVLCLACHTGNMIAARWSVLFPGQKPWQVVLRAWLWAGLIFAIILVSVNRAGMIPLLLIALLLSIPWFYRFWPREHNEGNVVQVWLMEAVLATVVSTLALLPEFWRNL